MESLGQIQPEDCFVLKKMKPTFTDQETSINPDFGIPSKTRISGNTRPLILSGSNEQQLRNGCFPQTACMFPCLLESLTVYLYAFFSTSQSELERKIKYLFSLSDKGKQKLGQKGACMSRKMKESTCICGSEEYQFMFSVLIPVQLYSFVFPAWLYRH